MTAFRTEQLRKEKYAAVGTSEQRWGRAGEKEDATVYRCMYNQVTIQHPCII